MLHYVPEKTNHFDHRLEADYDAISSLVSSPVSIEDEAPTRPLDYVADARIILRPPENSNACEVMLVAFIMSLSIGVVIGIGYLCWFIVRRLFL